MQSSGKQTKLSDFFYNSNENAQLEICLILFSHCNLHCSFCFQSQKADEIDVAYIESIPEKIKLQLPDVLKYRHIEEITYRIWGGEVFSDYLPDSMFDVYRKLIVDLENVGQHFGVKSTFCFSSNLVFENTTRVKEFITDKICVATSYDPIGRFQNISQIQRWQENVKLFNPICVSVTLTKQNIQKYIEEPIHFERLQHQSIYLEYYIYCRNYKLFAPSQDELFKFFKFCIDNKIFNISEIVKIFSMSKGRYCTCNNSCYFKNGKLTFDCIARSSDLPLSEFSIDENSVSGRVQSMLKKNNCMLCKHFKYCRMYCIASMLHKDFDIQNCALARTYDYIKEIYDDNRKIHN